MDGDFPLAKAFYKVKQFSSQAHQWSSFAASFTLGKINTLPFHYSSIVGSCPLDQVR
jgi:hypothetical protein